MRQNGISAHAFGIIWYECAILMIDAPDIITLRGFTGPRDAHVFIGVLRQQPLPSGYLI